MKLTTHESEQLSAFLDNLTAIVQISKANWPDYHCDIDVKVSGVLHQANTRISPWVVARLIEAGREALAAQPVEVKT